MLSKGRFLVRTAICASGLLLAEAFLSVNAGASPEIDRLSGPGPGGDRGALESLVEIARKRKDADAEYALGTMAYEGRGLERNAKQAFQLVERAAGRGHVESNHVLGYFHEHGIGTRVDLAQALAAYKRGAEGGSARARTNVGWFHEHGIGVEKDAPAATDWYGKATDQGLAAAQANLAALYESGNGVARDPIVAIALYEKAFAGGVVSVGLRLGQLLEARANLGEASKYYVAAAEARIPESDFAAGNLLIAASNPRRDIGQGIRWLEQSAADGKVKAALLLASLFDKGLGKVADPQRAAGYFQRGSVWLRLS